MQTRPVYIAGGKRTPFVKSLTDYRMIDTVELMTAALQALVSAMTLDGELVDDVALGAVNSSTHWNLARECVLATTLDPHTPAYNVKRACSTSLDATWQMALKIAHGQINFGIAGGVDSCSDLPLLLKRSLAQKLIKLKSSKKLLAKLKVLTSLRFSDFKLELPTVVEPRTKLPMGHYCEQMVQAWNISRLAQDELALSSYEKMQAAYAENFYANLVCEFHGLQADRILRTETTLTKLAKLPPVFDRSAAGTLTAGNSSPLTDGAAAVLLTSAETAKKYQFPLLARFVDAEVAAVDFLHGEGLLMAPTLAVSRLLQRQHLTLQDFDFYEIHEAFAGQVLCALKAWESEDYCRKILNLSTALGPIDRSKMNVKGGSIAIGHPFAATGARLVATLAKLLQQKGRGRGLISICTAGGMGVAAILEAV